MTTELTLTEAIKNILVKPNQDLKERSIKIQKVKNCRKIIENFVIPSLNKILVDYGCDKPFPKFVIYNNVDDDFTKHNKILLRKKHVDDFGFVVAEETNEQMFKCMNALYETLKSQNLIENVDDITNTYFYLEIVLDITDLLDRKIDNDKL